MATKSDIDRLLDVNEVAALLGVKRSTGYQWSYERRLPVVKLFGRLLRFRVSDIERVIRQGHRPAIRACGDPDAEGN